MGKYSIIDRCVTIHPRPRKIRLGGYCDDISGVFRHGFYVIGW